MLSSIILRPGGSCGLVRASFSATRYCWSRRKAVLIYKGNPTIMLWDQSETDTPRREKFGRCLAAARAYLPCLVRPPMSGRAQSKRDFSLPNDRFIAREAIYIGISFTNQCKYCVFCENPAKLFRAIRHSYRGSYLV